jgi:hypothetical protein
MSLGFPTLDCVLVVADASTGTWPGLGDGFVAILKSPRYDRYHSNSDGRAQASCKIGKLGSSREFWKVKVISPFTNTLQSNEEGKGRLVAISRSKRDSQ